MSSFLKGPIEPGEEFVLTFQQMSTLYILNSYQGETGSSQLFFDSNIPLGNTGQGSMPNVPLFIAAGSSGDLVFEGVNLGGLGYINNVTGPQAVLTDDPPHMSVVQMSNYTPWNLPTLFLTGAMYIIFNRPQSDTARYEVLFSIGHSNQTGPPTINGFVGNSFMFLPKRFFYDCTGSISYEINNIEQAVCSSYCSLNPSASSCTDISNFCYGLPTSGWTDKEDCSAGVNYQYCTNGALCSESCKGPCKNQFDICLYGVTGTTGFSCSSTVQTLSQWSQPWFILIIVILVIILILLFSFAFYWGRRNREN